MVPSGGKGGADAGLESGGCTGNESMAGATCTATAGFGSAGFGSAGFGSAGFGSAGFGSAGSMGTTGFWIGAVAEPALTMGVACGEAFSAGGWGGAPI